MNKILASKDNPYRFFHQFGRAVLDYYLNSLQRGCSDADVYKKIPRVARLFAFISSNGCDDVYMQAGRRKNEIEPYVYVMRSEVERSTLDALPAGLKDVILNDPNHDVTWNGDVATIDWVPEESELTADENYREKAFFDSLKHGVWTKLSKKLRASLQNWAGTRADIQHQKGIFSINQLEPYQVQVENSGNGKLSTMGWSRHKLVRQVPFC